MKLLLIKLSDESATEKVVLNLAGFNIMNEIIVDCQGMGKELKDYQGSLLGSLRVLFEVDRDPGKLILVTIEDNQVENALEAVERVVGNLADSRTGDFFLTLPIDFLRCAK